MNDQKLKSALYRNPITGAYSVRRNFMDEKIIWGIAIFFFILGFVVGLGIATLILVLIGSGG